jgi:hypothetical protein
MTSRLPARRKKLRTLLCCLYNLSFSFRKIVSLKVKGCGRSLNVMMLRFKIVDSESRIAVYYADSIVSLDAEARHQYHPDRSDVER